VIKSLLNLLFPNKCIICNSYASQNKICGECWGNCSFITKPYCALCSHPFEYDNDETSICGHCIANNPKYDKAISVFKYDKYSKEIIHKFKYNDHLHILDYFIGLMLNMGKEVIQQSDVIIPVPMHKYKLLKRGYNQSALLAMKLSSKSKIKYLPHALVKAKNTTPQADLKKDDRIKNVKNSFKLNSKFQESLKGKNILLIDDVVTTGATISECCKTLRKASPKKIFVLSLAKRV
jgi:ComF family protein